MQSMGTCYFTITAGKHPVVVAQNKSMELKMCKNWTFGIIVRTVMQFVCFVPVQFFPDPCHHPGYTLCSACSCCKWTWSLLSGNPSGICWWCRGLCLHQLHSALKGRTDWGLWCCWETEVSPGWSDWSLVSLVSRQVQLPPLPHHRTAPML